MMMILILFLSAANADTNFEHCDSPADCIVVQDGWCKRVKAIQKKAFEEWKSKDEEYVSLAKERKQLCSQYGPEQDIRNYTSSCYDHSCKAVSVR